MYLGWLIAVLRHSSLGDGNPTELHLGHVQINYKLKTDLQCCMVGKGFTATVEVQSASSVIQLTSTYGLYTVALPPPKGVLQACTCMYVHNLKANATSSGDMLSVATTVTSQYHLGFKDMVAKQQKARMVAMDNQGIMFTVA